MLILPYQKANNPWRLTMGQTWRELGLEPQMEIDLLLIDIQGDWRVRHRVVAGSVGWELSPGAFICAFRPHQDEARPQRQAVQAYGCTAAMLEQIDQLTAARDHYKRLWIDAEARRNLGLAEMAQLRHDLDLARDELAGLKIAA